MKITVPFCTCGCPSFQHRLYIYAGGNRMVECRKHGQHRWVFSGETREYDAVITDALGNMLVGWMTRDTVGLGFWSGAL